MKNVRIVLIITTYKLKIWNNFIKRLTSGQRGVRRQRTSCWREQSSFRQVPEPTWARFHQCSTYSFYARSSPKRKNSSQVVIIFLRFWDLRTQKLYVERWWNWHLTSSWAIEGSWYVVTIASILKWVDSDWFNKIVRKTQIWIS